MEAGSTPRLARSAAKGLALWKLERIL
jgi:hypothetical protein